MCRLMSSSISSCPTALAVDAAAECEAALREAGLAIAAAYAHDATVTLRMAMRMAEERRSSDGDHAPADGEILVAEDGRTMGVTLRPHDGVLAIRRPASEPATGTTRGSGGMLLAAAPVRDLGWELVGSVEAAALADDDLFAALLRRALWETGWIARDDGHRWSTSRTGAATILTLMRRGRAAVALRPSPGGTVEPEVIAILGRLGWRPDRPAPTPSN